MRPLHVQIFLNLEGSKRKAEVPCDSGLQVSMKALPCPLPLCGVSVFHLYPDLNARVITLQQGVFSVILACSQIRTRLPEVTGRALCPGQPFFISQYHVTATCLAFIARAT